jgi:hypothetical protein
MIRAIFLTIVGVIALWPLPGSGAVISRDWKFPGDGLLTYDDVNQREWLDLSQTLLSVQFPGNTRDERYQYVVGQLGPNGLFAGFDVAKSQDVVKLAQSAGIDTSTFDSNLNALPTLALGDLLSFTAVFAATGSKFSVGLIDEFETPPDSGQFGSKIGVSVTSQAGLRITSSDDLLVSPPPGVMLFRPVPEPAACKLLVIALAATIINLFHKKAT